MPVIGITGGVASGKSSFTARLASLLGARRVPIQVFDADAAARRLVESDAAIQQKIAARFGSGIVGSNGVIDRTRLREAVFGDAGENGEGRKALEAILHPAIRAEWTEAAEAARRSGALLLLDIPLLFETGAEGGCDAVAVVACRPETQRARIVANRGLTPEMAGKMIASQTSLASKAARADYVIWNDAPVARLDEQAELFAGYLNIWMNSLPR